MEIQDRMTTVFPLDDHIPAEGSFNLHTRNDARKHRSGNFLIHLISQTFKNFSIFGLHSVHWVSYFGLIHIQELTYRSTEMIPTQEDSRERLKSNIGSSIIDSGLEEGYEF